MRILVRGTNWIGDAVMSVPALKLLRASLPEARISLLTGSWARDVFDGVDFVDEIITLDADHKSIRGLFRQSSSLRERRFDATILFTNSFNSAILAHLSGIPSRIGFASGGRGILLTDSIKVPTWKSSRHESLLYVELVKEFIASIGAELSDGDFSEPRLEASQENLDVARKKLRDNGVSSEKPLVILGVGSQNSRAKRWPSAGFAELSDMLATELEASVLILGSAAERSVAEEVVTISETKPLIFAGDTDLSEAIGLISLADLYIGNDMGLTHLAPALGTETIAIFGPTNDIATRPLSNKAHVIRKNVECAPCMLRDCPIDHRCMTQIMASEVLSLAKKHIAVK